MHLDHRSPLTGMFQIMARLVYLLARSRDISLSLSLSLSLPTRRRHTRYVSEIMERLIFNPQQAFSTGCRPLFQQKHYLLNAASHCPSRIPFKCRAMVAENKAGLSYKDAGVDIDAGTELVRRIAAMAPGIGGFGGLFPLGDSYLVAGTDGVGTKLKLAFEMGKHDTIGIDLVAMSVNDIVTSGAKPLFFLDYFATSHLDVDLAEQVIKGIVDGCKQSDCVLLGGETAEMPGFYAKGEYDLSGFAVGIVEKSKVVNGKTIQEGDVLLGLPSSGVHSNGFSLVKRVLSDGGTSLENVLPDSEGAISIGEALMAPTVIYVKQVLELVEAGKVKGLAHITGGGFTDNIPRIFPEGLGASVNVDSWDVPPIFKWLKKAGGVNDAEMRRTFNMGIGMVIVASPESAEDILANKGDRVIYEIGQVVKGDGVVYC